MQVVPIREGGGNALARSWTAAMVVVALIAAQLAIAGPSRAESTPSLTLSQSDALDPAGQVVTVTGQGFDPTGNLGTRPPLSGQPAGVYVVFGRVAPTWQPSAGATSAERQSIVQNWALPAGSFAILSSSPGTLLMQADGSFTVDINVSKLDPSAENGDDTWQYGVFTFAGGGAVDAASEVFVPITFAEPAPEEGSPPAAPTPPAEPSPPAENGSEDDTTTDDTTDETTEDETTDETTEDEEAVLDTTTTDDEGTEDTTDDQTVVQSSSAPSGHLLWGVRESFRFYVRGPIAGGDIEVSGGAQEGSDGIFRFPRGSGTSDVDNEQLDVGFRGTVRMFGHESGDAYMLDFELSNVVVEIDGDTGMVYVDVRSRGLSDTEASVQTGVLFATLDLSGIDWDVADDTLTLDGIPATLTADGASAFSGFYQAGEALDPLTIVLGVNADGTLALADTGAPAVILAAAALMLIAAGAWTLRAGRAGSQAA